MTALTPPSPAPLAAAATALKAHRGAIAIAIITLAAGLGLGLWIGAHRSSTAPAAPAAARAAAPERSRVSLPGGAQGQNPLQTAKVTRTRLARDVEVVGSVGYDQNHYALIGPLIQGRVVALHVGVGDQVKAGQVLAEVESAEVGQAQAAYLTGKATNEAAQANLRRERELAEQKVSSEREKELAAAQAATEQANLAAAVQRLRAFGLRAEDIAALQPSRAGRSAGRIPLVAPLMGTVLTRQVTLGQAVQPAQDAFTVADLSKLWVVLDIFEKDLPYVHAGQRASLRTEVYPGRTFPARVAHLGQVIEEKTRTSPVRIEFENEDSLFRPGQFVTATLHGDKEHVLSEVLAVPRRAVLTVEGKPVVFVANGDGSFSRRPVELGVSGGGLVEIRSGVAEDEQVAVDGAFLLKSELLR